MNPISVVAILAYRVVKTFSSGRTVKWSEVESWIKHHANCSNYGRGYAANRLPSQVASSSFIELRKEQIKGSIKVVASVYLDSRSLRPSVTQSWVGNRLDGQLKKQFGNDLRIRINM